MSDLLNEYLAGFYDSPEGLAELAPIRTQQSMEIPNKMIFTLLEMERETGIRTQGVYNKNGTSTSSQAASPWHFSFYFMLAAIFDEKRYAESLRKLSTSIQFFQQQNTFNPDKEIRFTVEPVKLSFHELNNVWSMFGSHHYPAFFGKLRMLVFDGMEIIREVPLIKESGRSSGIKR